MLKEITGQIKRGDLLHLGPNGCGKSTLLKFYGELIIKVSSNGGKCRYGYFAQDIPLEHKGTVLDNYMRHIV